MRGFTVIDILFGYELAFEPNRYNLKSNNAILAEEGHIPM